MYPTQKPDFTWNGGCSDDPIQFLDLSVSDFGDITNWQWFFGGTNWGSTQQNPVIEINDRSTIDINLNITTDLGCRLSTTKTVDLNVVPNTLMEHSKLCLNTQPIVFKDLSTISSGLINSWQWIVYDESLTEIFRSQTQQMEYTFEAGTYFVNLEVTGNNGCSNAIQKHLVLFESLKIDALADVEICENNSFEINLTANEPVDSFRWTPYNELITNYVDQNIPIISPQNSEEYIITAYDLNGCSATDTFDVVVYSAPKLNIGNDTLICYRQQIFLQPEAEMVYDGDITYQWENSIFLDDINQFNQRISPDTSSIFYLTVSESTHNCSVTDSIFVKVDKPIIPTTSNDTIVCPGSTINLSASGGDFYSWYNNEQLLSENAEVEFTVSQNTEYTVNIANTCFNSESAVKVNIFDIPIISAGEDVEIDVGKSTTLNATFDEFTATNFFWTSNKDYLPTYTEKSISITPYENSWYTLTVVTPDNCLVSDTVNVYVKNIADILLPNAFSPNDDGVNDIIVPILKGIKRINTFAIYNRYGDKVFQTAGNEIPWNGKYNNQPLAMGVYVYFVNGTTFFDESFSKKGNITLIR